MANAWGAERRGMDAKSTKHRGKRMAALLLALALSVMMVPAAAFAEGGAAQTLHPDKNECVQTTADGVEESTEVGNVVVTDGKPGVDADATNGGKATVKTGSVSSSEHNGINADAQGNGSVTVNAGDVTSGHDNGVQAHANGGGTVTVTAGNITSGENGTGVWASATDSASGDGSAVTVKAGNVKADGEGVYVRPGAKSTITIEIGDVRAKGDGAQIHAVNGGKVYLEATNITAGESGLFVYADASSDIEVLVTGSITGGRAPLAYYGSLPENFKLTVWKINLDEGSMTAAEREELVALMKAAGIDLGDKEGRWNPYGLADLNDALSQSINYIMKLGQSDGATLSATDANGNPLGTSHGYSVAKEGERVMLKVDLEEGCELVAAYDGNGNKVELVQAADGSYYIAYTVPKGGGLGLSVEVNQPLANTAIEAIENALASNSLTSNALAKAIAANQGSPLPKTGDGLPALPFTLLALASAAMLALARSKCRVTGRHAARR